MSGFDFDALRDPDAPRPGAHQREQVEARAHQLRAKTRRTRLLVSALAVVVVAGAVAGIVASRHNPGPAVSVTGPNATTTTTTPASSVGDRFIPPTHLEHGLTVMPVTFPDGESFTMHYPPAMRVAQLGFTSTAGIRWDPQANPCCTVVNVDYSTVSETYGDAQALASFPEPNGGRALLFRKIEPVSYRGPAVDELAMQFGPWLVQADGQPPTENNPDLMLLAKSLTATFGANGYVLLHATAPAHFGSFFSRFGAAGPAKLPANSISFTEGCPSPAYFHSRTPTRFGRCFGKLGMFVSGSTEFVKLGSSLVVDDFHEPSTATPSTSATTTTTTTTSLPGPKSLAISASFVSPDKGWVLEANGLVAETNDAGKTWREVGAIGPSTNWSIRFANSTRGFAFPAAADDQRPPLTTDDDGATWTKLSTPFGGSVSDLAIARGVVYAVAYPKAGIDFGIWSAPANDLVWTRASLGLQLGAGPIPSEELVFNGSRGWILNEDRAVIGGAELSPNGTWVKWAPPCISAAGPAYLAASTPTDLAASCEEGVYTASKPTNAVYFSHDGGATFQRRPAPLFGAIASASADSAVIVNGRTIERTTDSGATWQTVYAHPSTFDAPADLGFTTQTQGFVIFAGGEMIMTYDGGATWKPVTLP